MSTRIDRVTILAAGVLSYGDTPDLEYLFELEKNIHEMDLELSNQGPDLSDD